MVPVLAQTIPCARVPRMRVAKVPSTPATGSEALKAFASGIRAAATSRAAIWEGVTAS
ncbi:hypothetical protein D3C87_1040720 [compost metagenome]